MWYRFTLTSVCARAATYFIPPITVGKTYIIQHPAIRSYSHSRVNPAMRIRIAKVAADAPVLPRHPQSDIHTSYVLEIVSRVDYFFRILGYARIRFGYVSAAPNQKISHIWHNLGFSCRCAGWSTRDQQLQKPNQTDQWSCRPQGFDFWQLRAMHQHDIPTSLLFMHIQLFEKCLR